MRISATYKVHMDCITYTFHNLKKSISRFSEVRKYSHGAILQVKLSDGRSLFFHNIIDPATLKEKIEELKQQDISGRPARLNRYPRTDTPRVRKDYARGGKLGGVVGAGGFGFNGESR